MVTSSKPTTLREAVDLAFGLTKDAIRMGTLTRKGFTSKGSDVKAAEMKGFVTGSVSGTTSGSADGSGKKNVGEKS